jgi:oligopeptide/dipeptide ABC transporter ATP-binding protein
MNNTKPATPLLDIKNLSIHFPIRAGVFGAVNGHIKAVDDISFSVHANEVFALVGESGCGKTTTALAGLGLIPPTAGTIKLGLGPWRESPVTWQTLVGAKRRLLRRSIQIIFQDPFGSLDPRMTVRQILSEPLRVHHQPNIRERLKELLDQVGLSDKYLDRYPHEFSGGQRQRIGIARALSTRPELIVADEPVSALDVSIRAQIINLLEDLRETNGQSLLIISHDLAVVRHMSHRVAVMYAGHIVESGTNSQIYDSHRHPYTQLLLDSIPVPGKGRATRSTVIAEAPSALPETGCPFYPRCPKKSPQCEKVSPELVDVGGNHLVACWNK